MMRSLTLRTELPIGKPLRWRTAWPNVLAVTPRVRSIWLFSSIPAAIGPQCR